MKISRVFIIAVLLGTFILALNLFICLKDTAQAWATVQSPAPVASLPNNDDLLGWTNAGLYGGGPNEMAFDTVRDQVFLLVPGAAIAATMAG